MTGLETIIILNTIAIGVNTFFMFINTKIIGKATEQNV